MLLMVTVRLFAKSQSDSTHHPTRPRLALYYALLALADLGEFRMYRCCASGVLLAIQRWTA
jgi:hypothetical protein